MLRALQAVACLAIAVAIGCGDDISDDEPTVTTTPADASPDPDAPDDDPIPDAGVGPTSPPLPSATMPGRAETRTCRFGEHTSPALAHGDPAPGLPPRLSDAHCFADLPTLTPGPDLLPYRLNAPLWTDGAGKQRYITLPPGETITVHDDGRWEFPVGAAILKTFAFASEHGLTPVELRVMVRREAGWQFATYAFEPDGTDATLTEGGYDVELDFGAAAGRRYYYPDDAACRICHRYEGERHVLGPRTPQLDRWLDFGGVPRNQIDAMFEAGWIDRVPQLDAPDVMPALADDTAPIEDRARAYLHGNCSHCHRPGGWQPIGLQMDLRYGTPLADAAICDAPLSYTSPWAGGTHRIAPGDLDDSNIFQRMSLRGDGQMPLFGTYEIDPMGLQLVQDWIEQLEVCPGDE